MSARAIFGELESDLLTGWGSLDEEVYVYTGLFSDVGHALKEALFGGHVSRPDFMNAYHTILDRKL